MNAHEMVRRRAFRGLDRARGQWSRTTLGQNSMRRQIARRSGRGGMEIWGLVLSKQPSFDRASKVDML